MSSPLTTLTGILVDVSDSMRHNMPGGDLNAPWIRSIFKVMDNLIKHDVSPENYVFSIAFGGSGEDGAAGVDVFDVIGTIDSVSPENRKAYEYMSHQQRVWNIISILEQSGAKYIRTWIKDMNLVEQNVSPEDSATFLHKLESDSAFKRAFIDTCLPRVCREGVVPTRFYGGSFVSSCVSPVVSTVRPACESDIREVVEKVKRLLIVRVTDYSIFDVRKGYSILHGGVGEKELTDDRVRELTKSVEPYIYGSTPLFSALQDAARDLCINQYSAVYTAMPKQRQEGGTCYAHALAVVLHMAMKRILGRDGGYPDFDYLRKEMIDRYGANGANTSAVLRDVCPRYRLRYREVDIEGALEAVAANRPVVANFRLTGDEWRQYTRFFDDLYSRHGVLTTDQVDISRRMPRADTRGHAVVLTSFNSEYLRFMDSWGWGWADDGFIKVKNDKVLGMKFFDVFCHPDDLLPSEKACYKAHGPGVAARLWKSLTGLQHSTCECPLCHTESPVEEFKGNIGKVWCPRCWGEFKGSDSGNVLALNMYLTSISTQPPN